MTNPAGPRAAEPGPTGAGAGRYAPSPTGDLHLGNLRTAVVAWLFARSTGRRFLLRFEDLDSARVRPGVAARQQADLTALGVTFDDVPVVQSERRSAYAAALDRLADQTYECFCTRREIAEAASAPHGDGPRYPGTCRELSRRQRSERARTRTPALRLRSADVEVTITDLRHGTVTGRPEDVVLRRNDGTPAYHLAVVVDDGDARVDQVVRGDDLLPAAVDQAYLAGLLGYPAPTYAHVPLAVNAAGARLAKRDGAVTLATLASVGVGVAEIRSAIAASLRLPPDRELAELVADFDPDRLPREPWVVAAGNRPPAGPPPAGARVPGRAELDLAVDFQRPGPGPGERTGG